ncbi:peptidylprolyl isomerase [Mangrovibacillus cuniculi]|uniref:Peptidyl-prolyl cis-trans isomerase n=1 Tax=Mangrovibacillus cuniculi TaxID=2593652 RepID=A0A7S8CCA1_9BACI|nr:peptidylprolyl isomerase [Mangrovibacillus cuniculi]QPC47339.1 peptidylprolyl isomerase [Mangrovibacillus cuniculi]
MKKWLVGLSLVVLAGCGTNASEGTNGNGAEQTEQTEENPQVEETEAVNYPQLDLVSLEENPTVTMKTNLGDITIALFPKQAPKAVENFITHSKNGYYDGVTFHRVIQDFMIQGGDPQGTGMGGESIYGAPFEDEFSKELFHFTGALSMANSGPNSNGSQFFIVKAPAVTADLVSQMKEVGFPDEVIGHYEEVGGTAWLDGKHTVFGQVVEGMDVVEIISTVETGQNDAPVEKVVIEGIEVQE